MNSCGQWRLAKCHLVEGRQDALCGGRYYLGEGCPVVAWADAGRGARRVLPGAHITLAGLATLPNGQLLVAAQDPFLGLLEPGGKPRWVRSSPQADFRDQYARLALSADGTMVDFGFEVGGKSPLRFDLRLRKLSGDAPADQQTIPAKQAGLAVESWHNGVSPTLDGKPIKLDQYEQSRSLAIAPDSSRFVLGSEWALRAFDAKGQQTWRRKAPGTVWAVNISGDGRLAIAAYGDGTIAQSNTAAIRARAAGIIATTDRARAALFRAATVR
jgi:hypothetical protein